MPQQYKVPQNIDLEDKIVGPFTMKQFAYLMGGGLLVYSFYQIFIDYINGTIYTVIASTPIVIIAICLTFVKINDRPFEYFVVNLFSYIFSKKYRIWHQNYTPSAVVIKTTVKQKAVSDNSNKQATLDEIATSLDLAAGNTGEGGGVMNAQKELSAKAQKGPGVEGVNPNILKPGGNAPASQKNEQPHNPLSKLFSA
jgi:hypothetical protein